MQKLIKIAVLSLLLIAFAAPLTACNTIEGVGRDAKAAGEAISGAASDNKGY